MPLQPLKQTYTFCAFPSKLSTGGRQVAFTATMSPMTKCFGPFTSNVPIPYKDISLNSASGYNAALGTSVVHSFTNHWFRSSCLR